MSDALDYVRLTLGGGIIGSCVGDLVTQSLTAQCIGALAGMYVFAVLLHVFEERP